MSLSTQIGMIDSNHTTECQYCYLTSKASGPTIMTNCLNLAYSFAKQGRQCSHPAAMGSNLKHNIYTFLICN